MRTVLYDEHIALGAQMTDFAGWEMPVKYSGILEEHRAVRQGAGLFDVSHMGELYLMGKEAYSYLNKLLTHNMSRLLDGKWAYSPMCYPSGGTVDDVIVYPWREGYLVCVNASNTDKDFEWIKSNAPEGVAVENISASFAQLALQGPDFKAVLEKVDLSAVHLKTPTGYTGERGCELYLAPENAPSLWCALIAAGAVPCGLGARDVLRTEAALPLYGHELSPEISPYEAGLDRFIDFSKQDFIGREALLRQREDNKTRRLTGIVMQGRAIARSGYEVFSPDGEPIGIITSGGVSPSLGRNIALCLLRGDFGGESVLVRIRGKNEPAEITPLPFYKKIR